MRIPKSNCVVRSLNPQCVSDFCRLDLRTALMDGRDIKLIKGFDPVSLLGSDAKSPPPSYRISLLLWNLPMGNKFLMFVTFPDPSSRVCFLKPLTVLYFQFTINVLEYTVVQDQNFSVSVCYLLIVFVVHGLNVFFPMDMLLFSLIFLTCVYVFVYVCACACVCISMFCSFLLSD